MVCRAGATTLAELTVCRKPSILVPFAAAADNHQVVNATSLLQAGAAVMIEERDLTGELLASEIRAILAHPERREAMARAAGRLGSPAAASEIADVCAGLSERRWGSRFGQDRGPDFKPVRPRRPPRPADREEPMTLFRSRHARIHFVGIGGIGMSGIAEVLLNLGYAVSGSDLKGSEITRRLAGAGRPHRASATTPRTSRDADVVVISSAVQRDNPEVVEARGPEDPGHPARRDAGRADAAQVRHRHRRLARQDHHHLDGGPPCWRTPASTRPWWSAAR